MLWNGQSTLPHSINNKEQLTTGTKLNPVAILWRKPQGQEVKHCSSTSKPLPVALSGLHERREGTGSRARVRRGKVDQLYFPHTHYLKKGIFPPSELSRAVLAHSLERRIKTLSQVAQCPSPVRKGAKVLRFSFWIFFHCRDNWWLHEISTWTLSQGAGSQPSLSHCLH